MSKRLPSNFEVDSLSFGNPLLTEIDGEKTMPTNEHKKAAELHQDAAKSHLAAADSHGKGDAAKGTEHAKVAHQHSQSAAKQTDQPTTEVTRRGPVKSRASLCDLRAGW